jgi:ABC-type enterochelin transport system substrate-binding protein
MKVFMASIALVLVLALTACGSAERRAARAQASAASAQESAATAEEDRVRQRLDLIEQYQECVREAGGIAGQIEACDTYLNAAAALQ